MDCPQITKDDHSLVPKSKALIESTELDREKFRIVNYAKKFYLPDKREVSPRKIRQGIYICTSEVSATVTDMVESDYQGKVDRRSLTCEVFSYYKSFFKKSLVVELKLCLYMYVSTCTCINICICSVGEYL